jgi:methylated-DNA-[protein]-cysteine S-methyltransferase
MPLILDRIDAPIGTLLLVCDGEALVALDFDDDERGLRHDLAKLGFRETLESGTAPARVRQALERYFTGDPAAIDAIAVRYAGSPFRRQVHAALRTIPAGETRSYGEIAAAIGRPGASRAVGLANRSNPIAIVVPCHRVIGANGTLTGYAGGLARKRWLLAHEARYAKGQAREGQGALPPEPPTRN